MYSVLPFCIENFILNDARIDELEFFSELINNRMQELKNNNSN